MHGGAPMAPADNCGGICAFLNLPAGATATATIESKAGPRRRQACGHGHPDSGLPGIGMSLAGEILARRMGLAHALTHEVIQELGLRVEVDDGKG
jgi:hypothetical protein